MPKEIERKFLVIDDSWRKNALKEELKQGYILREKNRVVRIRTVDAKGYITVKALVSGIERLEFEYEIPYDDAIEMLDKFCTKPLIEKTRHLVIHNGQLWEIDEFHSDNRGLIVAEAELESAGQALDLPVWAGKEVSEDPRYYNANLSLVPYTSWPDDEKEP